MRNKKTILVIGLVVVLLVVGACFVLNRFIAKAPPQPEASFEETHLFKLVTVYDTIKADEPLELIWSVSGREGDIATHVAIHWGSVSNFGDFGFETDASETGYPNFTEEHIGDTFTLPNTFTDSLVISKPGTYYYRLHATIDGQHHWSEEYSFIAEE